LADFVSAARAQPGTLNIGTTARGSSSHLAAELLRLTAGINVTVVPYRNPADLPIALLRNDVAMVLDTHALLKPTMDDNQTRALATTGGKRSAALPNVPTAAEGGLTGYEVTSWNGIFAPAGTPPDVVARLNREYREILARPEVKARLLKLSLEAQASSPEELGARLKGDIEKWAKVIAQAGIEKQ
jgi:tripartite-type tricarboxylate transporter receptor subunit TctC